VFSQQLRILRRLKIMARQAEQHFALWPVGSQQLHVAFDGGRLVSDAGLLAVRALEKPLRVIADLAQRLPDPRAPTYIEHSAEALLTQAVYQILAGYPDCNDAQDLRGDLPRSITFARRDTGTNPRHLLMVVLRPAPTRIRANPRPRDQRRPQLTASNNRPILLAS
jgi:hypothetical protein